MLTRFPVTQLLLCSALVLLVAVSGTSSAQAFMNNNGSSLINVKADHQSYDEAKKKFVLKGNVKVNYQDFQITGNTADMTLGAGNQPAVASFYNRPLVTRSKKNDQTGVMTKDNIRGDVVRLNLKDNLFGAEGNVHSLIATVAANPFTIRADVQQFDNARKLVTANGNVQVNYEGADVSSNQALLRVRDDGKADKVVFSGGAHIKKKDSQIHGGKITVMVGSGNLIAENNVKTQVDLKGNQGANRVMIYSDHQQYDKATDKMLASGHVKIIYGDYVATGTKATFKLKGGGLDRILLTGRPTISEKTRTITADSITITTKPKHFDAVGNVQIQFKTGANGGLGSSSKSASAKKSTGGKTKAGSTAAPASSGVDQGSPEDDLLDY